MTPDMSEGHAPGAHRSSDAVLEIASKIDWSLIDAAKAARAEWVKAENAVTAHLEALVPNEAKPFRDGSCISRGLVFDGTDGGHKHTICNINLVEWDGVTLDDSGIPGRETWPKLIVTEIKRP